MKGKQGEKNLNLAFVTTLDQISENTKLHIAAENVYRLYVNGILAGYGPVRTAHRFTKIAEYPLGQYLNQGKLNIVVEVAGYNVNTYCTTMDAPSFAAEIERDGEIIVSTDKGEFEAHLLSDRVQKAQRYSFQRAFTENYHMTECRSHFYQGSFDRYPKVETEEVEGTRLLKAPLPKHTFQMQRSVILDHGNVEIIEPKDRYESRHLAKQSDTFFCFNPEEIEEKLTFDADSFEFVPGRQKENPYELYDLGRNVTGFLSLDIQVEEDTKVYILWDEILTDQERKTLTYNRVDMVNIVKWELKAGDYQLLSFEPYTMRYAYVAKIGGKASVKEFGIRRYENEDRKIKLSVEDAQLTDIFEAAIHSFEQNAVDILMDCPSRERAGWLCDSYFTAQAEQLITGRNVVEQNFLENYLLAVDSNIPNKMIPMCYPADHTDHNFIANYSCWFVVELLDYYKRTGDRELIDRAKEKVMGILVFFQAYENEYGLLEHMDGWVFVEWSKAADFVQDVNFPSNMLYAHMLQCVDKLYDIPELLKKSESIKEVIRVWSWRGEYFSDNALRMIDRAELKPDSKAVDGGENQVDNGDIQVDSVEIQVDDFGMTDKYNLGTIVPTDNITETCQYYAFYFDTAKQDTDEDLFMRMLNEFGANRDCKKVHSDIFPSNAFIGNYLRLDYYSKHGYPVKVMEECKEYFLGMAEMTSSLWEYDSTVGSCNHGFTSYTANLIIRGLTGFQYACIKDKKIYFTNHEFTKDCQVEIPIENSMLKISIRNGSRTIYMEDNLWSIITEG
jgi:alpha-L-rhamnosidase